MLDPQAQRRFARPGTHRHEDRGPLPGPRFERIDEGREIGDGENIAFGNVRFRFEVIQPEPPIAAPVDEVIEPQPTE